MSPEQKAYLICLEYSNILQDRGNITKKVKECAFLLVQEQIDLINGYNSYSTMQYWLDVGKEINKL